MVEVGVVGTRKPDALLLAGRSFDRKPEVTKSKQVTCTNPAPQPFLKKGR